MDRTAFGDTLEDAGGWDLARAIELESRARTLADCANAFLAVAEYTEVWAAYARWLKDEIALVEYEASLLEQTLNGQ